MAVRNFWVEANIDGYVNTLKGGPRSKDGDMDITIYQRSNGTVKTAFRIHCGSFDDGLITSVFSFKDGKEVCCMETVR